MSSDEQVSTLAKELMETQDQSEQVVKQWQDRSDQLQANINELEQVLEKTKASSEETVQRSERRLEDQQKEAAEAIAAWEERCSTLNGQIENLELQIEAEASKKDVTISDLKADAASLTFKLEKHKDDISEVHNLKAECSTLVEETAKLRQKSKDAVKESEESQVVALELQEELRHSKEELQSFATDQFTAKATEMATEALRLQMEEVRSQYAVDQEILSSEKEARRAAEEENERLKSDLALLAQATEYNEDIDVHVRRVAKKMNAQNIKTERKEMEELRCTIERLREEVGSCRWKEREAEEKASNARLQLTILEQEVNAAKTDLALLEQAMEELETSKIDMSVSLEYRIEALENERRLAEQSYEEELYGIKAELAQSNEERDEMSHKLHQSEKANAALVYSTSSQYESLAAEESESEVIKLQLERAQLLAKINEIGADTERRVREAVATQASQAEAELIVEKQSQKSVESSLSDALSELREVKRQMKESGTLSSSGELAANRQAVQDLNESLDDMRMTNDEIERENKALQDKLDAANKENKSTINDLQVKLAQAEERLRSEEREVRFERAMTSEIANLRRETSNGNSSNPRQSQALILRGIDLNMQPHDESKESATMDRNSAYIIEMYDYVVELKNSITEERQMYKELLEEHEDLLALLGQAGLEGIST